VSYKGDTTYSSEYPAGHFSQIARVTGMLDEVGGFQASNAPLGPTERLLYYATFAATTTLPGGATYVTTTFRTDPADDLPLHETALNKPPEPSLGNTQIEFGESSLDIVDLPKQAQIRLEVTDLNGNPLPNNQIIAGTQFYLQAWVDDVRNLPSAQQAVYSAYLDVTYDRSLASPVASATNGLKYDVIFGNGNIGTGIGKTPVDFGGLPTTPPHAGQSGDFSVPGFINEIGAIQNTTAPVAFAGEALLFRARFTALTPPVGGFGTLVFSADPADILPLHEITVLPQTTVPPARVNYVSSTPAITVIAAAGEAEFTNPGDPFDVNDDGAASPVDALILINFLNEFGNINLAALTGAAEGESGHYYYDTNRDRLISATDVLGIINHLNSLSTATGEGEALDAGPGSLLAGVDAPVAAASVSGGSNVTTGDSPVLPGPRVVEQPAMPAAEPAAPPASLVQRVADELPGLEAILADELAEDILAGWNAGTGRLL
jgi:hypothetical protein